MNLTFNKINDVFVSEFSVTSDFNLHVERSKGGSFTIFQRSSDGGNYGEVYYQEKLDKIKAIDYDFSALIYPKYIKIVSEVEPTYAAITTDGEVTEIKTQSKEIEITSNGTTVVTPDSGFAYLDKVTVNTQIESETQQVEITKNGTKYVYPQTTNYLDYVRIDTKTPEIKNQSKNININSNGFYQFVPDEGYTGIDKISINAIFENTIINNKAIKSSDINFFDYDGTLIYSCSSSELQKLNALPTVEHEGLIFQGWNWTLEELKTVKKADVGALYITDDGSTRLYVLLSGKNEMVKLSASGNYTVDWGDGSTSTSNEATGRDKIIEHTYGEFYGEMCISIKGSNIQLGTYNSLDSRTTAIISGAPLIRVEWGCGKYAGPTFYNINSIRTITSSADNLIIPRLDRIDFYSIPRGIVEYASGATCSYISNISFPKETNMVVRFDNIGAKRLIIPEGVTTLNNSSDFSGNAVEVIFPSTIQSIYRHNQFAKRGGVLDFRKATVVVSYIGNLTSTLNDYVIVVPDSLYSEWISADNWKLITKCIIKASAYEYN